MTNKGSLLTYMEGLVWMRNNIFCYVKPQRFGGCLLLKNNCLRYLYNSLLKLWYLNCKPNRNIRGQKSMWTRVFWEAVEREWKAEKKQHNTHKKKNIKRSMHSSFSLLWDLIPSLHTRWAPWGERPGLPRLVPQSLATVGSQVMFIE